MADNRISGTEVAQAVVEKVAKESERLIKEHSVTPGLAVIIVGEDPD